MTETIHLQLLLAAFAGWVGRQQSHVIAYLIEENRVLKEQLESGGRRLRFTDDQRRRLAAKGKPLGWKVLKTIATIVTPPNSLYTRQALAHRLPGLRCGAHASRSRRSCRWSRQELCLQ